MRQTHAMTVTLLLLAVSLALASPAYAGAWYTAVVCIGEQCQIYNDCHRSDESPKDIYDSARRIGDDDAKITDRADGGVEVTYRDEQVFHTAVSYTLFRSAEACKAYTGAMHKAIKVHEQEEDKENQKYN